MNLIHFDRHLGQVADGHVARCVFLGVRFELWVITLVQFSGFWEAGNKFLQPGDDTVFYKQW